MPNRPHPPLVALWDEVHAAFDRVFERRPDALACRSGCANCCVSGISVSQVEADAITGWLEDLPAEQRASIGELAARPEEGSCVLLDAEMGCSIYPVRPVICRVFGIPMRQSHPPSTKPSRCHLPIFGVHAETAQVVNTCHKNFIAVSIHVVKDDEIVDDQALERRRVAASAGFSPRDGSPALPPTALSSLAELVRSGATLTSCIRR